jgi:hypothetical protein
VRIGESSRWQGEQKIAPARAPPSPPPPTESTDGEEEEVTQRPKRAKPKPKGTRSGGLNRNGGPEDVAQAARDKFAEWEKDIYLNREENPGAYNYRFVDPGEERHRGAWTAAEERHFIAW